ncbi:MAG: TetR/AcrR family transcriptional regulator [Bacteroidia bacterium]
MRERDPNKEQIIRHNAIEMIVKDGFDGLSMQKLAKKSNVSPATIYIYFKDRNDLIEQLAIDSANALVAHTFKGFSPDMTFAQGMKIQWQNRADFFIAHPIQAKFMEQVKHSPVGVLVHQKIKKEFSIVMRDFILKAIKNKELIKLPIEIFWSLAFAPLYQLIKFHNDGYGLHHEPFVLTKAILNRTLKITLKGLKP